MSVVMHRRWYILSGLLLYLPSSLSEVSDSKGSENQILIHGISLNENTRNEKDEISTEGFKNVHFYACSHLKGLSPGQLKHCHIYEDHMEIVIDGIRVSLHECQKRFKHQRWNCTLSPEQRTFFGPIFKIGCKEASYLQAITSAGVMYAIARACKDGQLTRCGCSTLPRPRNLRKEWLWKGCGDNLEYAYKFTKNLMDIKEHEEIYSYKKSDKGYSRALTALHNNEAGRRAVLKQAKITCKCHGVSGSCTLITCWHQLPTFAEIGDFIADKYHSAVKVKKNKKGRLQTRNANGKRSTVTDLVYVHTSPDFCEHNSTYGILGTENRECLSKSGAGNCEELCCSRGYNVRKIFAKEKCNCQFHWCCFVKCDYCVSPRELRTCK